MNDWKLAELLPYMTKIPGGIGQPVMAFLVNEAKWNSISEQDRKSIMEVSGEKLAAAAGQNYASSEEAAYAKLQDAGVTIEEASAALVEELKQVLAPVEAEWVTKAKKSGLSDPADVLAEFRADMAAAE